MTTTVLRPNGSVSGTYGGAASLHAALSDDSDSSYGTSPSEVYLGTVAMSGGVTKTIKISDRSYQTTGTTFSQSRVRNGNTGAPYTDGTLARVDSAINPTPTTHAGTPVAVSLTQSQVDNLTALFWIGYSVPSEDTVRTAEIWVELVWVAKPTLTVTAVSPDPYTASTYVPLSWVPTLDSDGGAQTRFHVKVFTAAQYGAGGFDPETSAAYWESTETLGADSGITTGALANSTTYRAYVKVAQTVNGASHWSAWAYDQFQVAVTTSDVSSVTLVASNSTASVAVTVNRNTGSSAWNYVEVQRTIDSGTTWTNVRGATYVDATGSANTFAVTDYEVGNGVTVKYRARATRIVTGLPITGAWVESSTTSWTSTTDCWLKVPGTPALNMVVPVRVRPAIQRSRPYGNFRIVGSSNPVVVSDALGGATSTLEILRRVSDASLVTLLSQPVLLLQPPPAWDLDDQYLAPLEVTYTPGPEYADRRALWSVSVVEVDTPGDPLASAP